MAGDVFVDVDSNESKQDVLKKAFTRKEAIMMGDTSVTPMTREEAILAGEEVKAFTRDDVLKMGMLSKAEQEEEADPNQ